MYRPSANHHKELLSCHIYRICKPAIWQFELMLNFLLSQRFWLWFMNTIFSFFSFLLPFGFPDQLIKVGKCSVVSIGWSGYRFRCFSGRTMIMIPLSRPRVGFPVSYQYTHLLWLHKGYQGFREHPTKHREKTGYLCKYPWMRAAAKQR